MTDTRSTFHIEGLSFSTLEEFFDHFGRSVWTWPWGKNLDAFNDILRGGFGTPDGGFILCWHNHGISKQRLGYEETVRQLQLRLGRCHPANRDHVTRELNAALLRKGPTVFDWLIEIISAHGPGGDEQEDKIELRLQ
ncbi:MULTISPECIES: barstar family protein [unclassified Bradyrhizobium]|uniref:barstar family protein n=1 Tax=unclassified Bradyrhizobium TaxID=2631580 RepID=UPI0028EF5415|nr:MULTISPECIES: barstar family protein [unclassified Bradyrhizobium]